MDQFDRLVDALAEHIGTSREAIQETMADLNNAQIEVLTRWLDTDQITHLLDATGINLKSLSRRDLNIILETIAKVVSEQAESGQQGAADIRPSI